MQSPLLKLPEQQAWEKAVKAVMESLPSASSDALFGGVALFARTLAAYTVHADGYVGVLLTCVWIASKYHDNNVEQLVLKDIVRACGGRFGENDFVQAEIRLLTKALKWDCGGDLVNWTVNALCLALEVPDVERDSAMVLARESLSDWRFTTLPIRVVARASLMAAHDALYGGGGGEIMKKMEHHGLLVEGSRETSITCAAAGYFVRNVGSPSRFLTD